jgi:hypothetical protein
MAEPHGNLDKLLLNVTIFEIELNWCDQKVAVDLFPFRSLTFLIDSYGGWRRGCTFTTLYFLCNLQMGPIS